MKILLCQSSPKVNQIRHNADIILSALQRGINADVDVILLPSFMTTGYPPNLEDTIIWQQQKSSANHLSKLIKRSGKKITLIYGGIEEDVLFCNNARRYNVAYVVNDQDVRTVRKQLLPTYDLFNEAKYFHPGEKNSDPIPIELNDGTTQFCNVLIGQDIDNFNFKSSKCLAPNSELIDPLSSLHNSYPLFILASAPFYLNSLSATNSLLQNISSSLKCPVFWCNSSSTNYNIMSAGHSAIVSNGQVFNCKAFQDDEMIFDTATNERIGYIDVASKIHDIPIQPEDVNTWYLYRSLVSYIQEQCRALGVSKVVFQAKDNLQSALVATLAADAIGSENVTGVAIGLALNYFPLLAKRLFICFLEVDQSYTLLQACKDALLSGAKQVYNKDVTPVHIQQGINDIILRYFADEYKTIILGAASKYDVIQGGYVDNESYYPFGDLFNNELFKLAEFINKYRVGLVPSQLVKKCNEGLNEVVRLIIEEGQDLITVQKQFPKLGVYEINRQIRSTKYPRNYLKIKEGTIREGHRFPS